MRENKRHFLDCYKIESSYLLTMFILLLKTVCFCNEKQFVYERKQSVFKRKFKRFPALFQKN